MAATDCLFSWSSKPFLRNYKIDFMFETVYTEVLMRNNASRALQANRPRAVLEAFLMPVDSLSKDCL